MNEYLAGLLSGLIVVVGMMLLMPAEAQPVLEYCYAPYGSDVQPEYQVGHTLIRINWLDQTRGNTVESEWIYDEATNMSLCEVWIRIPEQILGDPDMDSLGHEFLHCLVGGFHPEDK